VGGIKYNIKQKKRPATPAAPMMSQILRQERWSSTVVKLEGDIAICNQKT
jgi:hypothetical protein